MKRSRFKNLLAFFGAIFIFLIILTFAVTIVSRDAAIGFGDKVGLVRIQGVILDSTEINEQIKELADRDDVKAVVLRIDSPGGGVGASQEIYREVKRLGETKKVVASLGAVAASGGYYIASAAHMIMANPGTITGSIGVIVEFMNFEGLLSKVGLKGYVIKSGKFKDMGSPLREMTDEEKELLTDLVSDVHNQFVRAVADGRGMDVKNIERIADGRILTGLKARKLGLVDYIGNLGDAIELGGKIGGIEGKPKVVEPRRKGSNLWRYLLGDAAVRSLGGFRAGLHVMYLAQPFY